MFKRWTVLVGLVFALPAAAQDLGLAGPDQVDVRTGTVTLTQPAASMAADFYLPRGTGARPFVVLAHGFGSEKIVWGEMGRHLASWGFVVVAPTLPNGFAGLSPDHVKNGQIIRAMLDTWAPAQNALSTSPIFGRVDVAQVGAVGHSAGGLSTVLALAARPGTVGVMLDWVDAGGGFGSTAPGAAAIGSITDPAAFLFSEPGSCNTQGNGVGPSADVQGPTLQLRVDKANHCDPIDSTAFACSLTCGAPVADRQKLFRAYTTAWLRRFLQEDRASTDTYLGGSTFAADKSAGRIKDASIANMPTEPVDAGTPVDAGPAVDAGSGSPDAGQGTPDAGTPTPDAGNTTPDAGTTTTDAGSTPRDAGTTPNDAGSSTRDAGTSSDAGGSVDAGEDGGEDGGGTGGAEGGCSCGTGVGGAAALLALVIRRRRRGSEG